jgi:hypothetical protein
MFKYLFSFIFLLTLFPSSYAAEYMPEGMIDINSFEVGTDDKYYVECSGSGFKALTINPAWLEYLYGHLDNPPTSTIDSNKANIGAWNFKLAGYWVDNTTPLGGGHFWFKFKTTPDEQSFFNFNGDTTTYGRLSFNDIDVIQWGTKFSLKDIKAPNDIPITSFTLNGGYTPTATFMTIAPTDNPDRNPDLPLKYIDFPLGRFILSIEGGIVEPDYFSDASCSSYKAGVSESNADSQDLNQDNNSLDSESVGDTGAGAFNYLDLLLLIVGLIFIRLSHYFSYTGKGVTHLFFQYLKPRHTLTSQKPTCHSPFSLNTAYKSYQHQMHDENPYCCFSTQVRWLTYSQEDGGISQANLTKLL